MAFSRSPDMAWAVSAMIGIAAVWGAALSCRVASQPSSTGKLMSIRITSGPSAWAQGHPFGAIDGQEHRVALALQAPREHVPVHLVVFDDQDRGHRSPPHGCHVLASRITCLATRPRGLAPADRVAAHTAHHQVADLA